MTPAVVRVLDGEKIVAVAIRSRTPAEEDQSRPNPRENYGVKEGAATVAENRMVAS